MDSSRHIQYPTTHRRDPQGQMQTDSAMEQERTNDDHIQRRTTSPAPSTPTRTTAGTRRPDPTSPGHRGTPNVRRSRDHRSGKTFPSPTPTEYRSYKARPTAAKKATKLQPDCAKRQQQGQQRHNDSGGNQNQPRSFPNTRTPVTSKPTTAPATCHLDTPLIAQNPAHKKRSTAPYRNSWRSATTTRTPSPDNSRKQQR